MAGPRRVTRLLVALAALGAVPPLLWSQLAPSDSVTIALGPEYGHLPGWEVLSGKGWRVAWTAPVKLPVADLTRLHGGLVRFRREAGALPDIVTGWTTDGRAWRIRPVNRLPVDPAAPVETRGTVIDRFYRDLVSVMHPSAPVVAAAVYRTTGLETADPELWVLPREAPPPELASLAGQAVWIERDAARDERGAIPVLTTDSVLALVRRDPANRIDSRRFLAARLTDILLGDRARGPEAWRWRREETSGPVSWSPIAVRQEEAFLRPDGLDVTLFKTFMPGIVTFGPGMPELASLVWLAYDLDRPLLVELERPVWDSVAAALASRLTDAAIRSAVETMPHGLLALSDTVLERGLRARRDQLPAIVGQYFSRVNRYAEVELSGRDDQVRLSRSEQGDLDLAASVAGAATVNRRFRHGETVELRLHLGPGADTVRLEGVSRSGIGIRLTGAAGPDLIEHPGIGRTRRVVAYDTRTGIRVVPEGSLRVNPYPADRLRLWPDSGPRPSHPDWGVGRSPMLALDLSSDYGLLVGAGLQWRWYGFAEPDYRQRLRARVAYATRPGGVRATVLWERRNVLRNVHLDLGVKATSLDVVRFFGFGNETSYSGRLDDYRVTNREISLRTQVGISRTPELEFRLGPVVYAGNTDTTGAGLIGSTDPYGGGGFDMAGLEAEFNYTPARDRYAHGIGMQVTARGEFFPELLSVDRGAFGGVQAETRLVWVPADGSRWALASRLGGSLLRGAVPYTRAARIGGGHSLRGFETGRFAGDRGAFYGSLEGRARVARVRLSLLPSDIGTFVFWDVGRVWAAGESSSRLHSGSGLGLWIAPSLSWMPALQGLVARVHFTWAGERKTISFGSGFQF